LLLGLRGVVVRAADPDDEASRTTALNGVLRGTLARFPDVRYAAAVRVLFGLGAEGQNLMARRELAAHLAGHEVHHFRKRVEPRLLDQLAGLLLADGDRFTRSRVIAPRLTPVAGRQMVVADPFAWEVAEHEEALSRLWAAIYALRSELLAVERLVSLGANPQLVTRQAVTAAWRWARTTALAESYNTAFGGPTGDPDAQDWVALAGWTPPLTGTQVERLRAAAGDDTDRAAFVATLHDDTDLGTAWTRGLTAPDAVNTANLERPV
jgi:hypothetical protein